MKRIAIFASGSGSNAENIYKHFSTSKGGQISLILSENPNSFVLERAKTMKIPFRVFSMSELQDGKVKEVLEAYAIDFIVLAGFLKRIPHYLIDNYPNRIVNIHPALLPKFGGKGMYGMNVHQAVLDAGDTETGITIHWVNNNYDEGDIIFQARCQVSPHDTVESIAEKVHALEYEHFPRVIDSLL